MKRICIMLLGILVSLNTFSKQQISNVSAQEFSISKQPTKEINNQLEPVSGSVENLPHEFVVTDKKYGAVGDGLHDDTQAFQNAINDCIAANGKLIIPPTALYKHYRITKTLLVFPNVRKELQMDLECLGVPRDCIRYFGPKGTACFRVVGLRCSKWTGLKIKLGDTEGLVGVDLDCDNGVGSLSYVSFENCHIVLGKGVNQKGWKIGEVSSSGGDISNLQWSNCTVYGSNSPAIPSQFAWHIKGGNTLNNSLINCFTARVGVFYNNQDGGNGSVSFIGCGGSNNLKEFKISNSQNYSIIGGRWESGKTFLEVAYGIVSPAISLVNVEINDYHPLDGVMFKLDMPCSLSLDNCNLMGGDLAKGFGTNMITLVGGDLKGLTLYGRVFVRNGSIQSNSNTFITHQKKNGLKWYIKTEGVGKLNTKGVASSLFEDIYQSGK
ncbi:hypothetical protein [Pedobacter mucosus]|uniref:hypothetical protein n=1 Tax=Pedobacter mucosus TaxID=2895286 RepID=UPI001EE4B339|nr:hypothetical protein [Pedobacter mucosus]UKT64907.1 hypothetical protein LOK61_03835 [Pedobacter mucosus]